MMKTLGLVLGCLYLSWLPTVVHSILMTSDTDSYYVFIMKKIVNEIAVTAIYAGSLLDPLVYHWSCPTLRKAMRLILFPKSAREYYRNLALQDLFGGQGPQAQST